MRKGSLRHSVPPKLTLLWPGIKTHKTAISENLRAARTVQGFGMLGKCTLNAGIDDDNNQFFSGQNKSLCPLITHCYAICLRMRFCYANVNMMCGTRLPSASGKSPPIYNQNLQAVVCVVNHRTYRTVAFLDEFTYWHWLEQLKIFPRRPYYFFVPLTCR